MLNPKFKTIAPALVIWVSFAILAYFGEYPWFLIPAFKWVLKLEFVSMPLSWIIQIMGFSPLSPDWLTARFIVTLSILFNYALFRLLIGKKLAFIFLFLSFGLLTTNAIASPFDLPDTRRILYDGIALACQPALILLMIPAKIVYNRYR